MKKLTSNACCMAIFFGAITSHAIAKDSQLLMYASKLNVGHRIAEKCNESDPRYSVSYHVQANKIKLALKSKGLTEEVLAAAEKIPELSSSQYVDKFDRLTAEQQLKWCIHTMLDAQQEASLLEQINE